VIFLIDVSTGVTLAATARSVSAVSVVGILDESMVRGFSGEIFSISLRNVSGVALATVVRASGLVVISQLVIERAALVAAATSASAKLVHVQLSHRLVLPDNA